MVEYKNFNGRFSNRLSRVFEIRKVYLHNDRVIFWCYF